MLSNTFYSIESAILNRKTIIMKSRLFIGVLVLGVVVMSVDACMQQPLTPEPSEETLVTPSVPVTAPTEPPSPAGNNSCEGYTLFSSGQRTVLVDMNGELVHEWPIDGSPVKMLPGGSLLGRKSIRNDETTSPNQRSNFGGKGVPDAVELIQIGWDGQEEWSFSNWDDDGTGIMMSRQHHDSDVRILGIIQLVVYLSAYFSLL